MEGKCNNPGDLAGTVYLILLDVAKIEAFSRTLSDNLCSMDLTFSYAFQAKSHTVSTAHINVT